MEKGREERRRRRRGRSVGGDGEEEEDITGEVVCDQSVSHSGETWWCTDARMRVCNIVWEEEEEEEEDEITAVVMCDQSVTLW